MPAVGAETGPASDGAARISMAPGLHYPVLLLREGPETGAVGSPEHGSLLIGSSPEMGLVINDPGVSAIHARVFRRLDGWYVEDLGSAEGTRVGGVPVERAALADGDVIQVGPAASVSFTMVSRAQEIALRRLYDAARTDPATGALLAPHYEHRLSAAVQWAAVMGRDLSVVLLELDNYDVLLERWGKEGVDSVLGHLVATIRQRVGTESVVGRLREAEFPILIPGANLGEASRTAERLRIAAATARPLLKGALVPLSISVGVASLKCAEIPTCTDLMETAERRLREAILNGGNAVVSDG